MFLSYCENLRWVDKNFLRFGLIIYILLTRNNIVLNLDIQVSYLLSAQLEKKPTKSKISTEFLIEKNILTLR